MTVTRFKIDDAGNLVDRDGRRLGRLTSLSIDLHESWDYRGGSFESNGKDKKNSTPLAPEVLAVWQHYVDVFDAGRMTLNPQRRRVIEQALKVRSVEECCRAITGLSKSPHHMGENAERKTYTEIRYALRGAGHRGESNEERIDSMAARFSHPAVVKATSSTDVRAGRISDLKADVMGAWHSDASRPAPPQESLQRAAIAVAKLADLGVTVTHDGTGKPVFA